ncbi:related to laccase precursor [Ramularia collo-cygni]|uniref:laccase n=1 Tax=Ramularia collo-cygni TaxID=112498 RepID=A0A2D3VCP4_9PEZI|nr:related to laccase precursor [Ramularia collo-cygni]CZT19399.1 related to laccase precursor [Ramularia collo-cygni]
MHLFSIVKLLAVAAPIVASVLPTSEGPHVETVQRATSFQPLRPISLPDNRGVRKRQNVPVAIPIPVTFDILVSTLWGESIQVVGSTSELGSWDTVSAVSLTAAQYTSGNPLWSITVDIAADTKLTYKFIRILTDGSVEWEAGPDRTYTVPSNGATAAEISASWQSSISTTQTSTATPTRSVSTATSVPTAVCTNGPTSRGCWDSRFSIDTDFDEDWPSTGRVVSYDLTITNTTLAPDGFSRPVFAVNGQYPGPTIYANWGDTIKVTVNNRMENNGTAIHWHGFRMWHANGQDGVPGVTECPIAPGKSKTYTMTATQYGTSWYHSHFSSQYGDGVVGPIVIYGPATENYDIDLGPLPITDWYYPTVMRTASIAMHSNALAPTADTGLINGTMVSTSGDGGRYSRTVLTAGKKHRLRLINTAVDNHFMFSLDNHMFTVISADFVPIVPYNATWIFIGIGQRYDVVFTADQEPGSYWFRAQSQDGAGCGSNFQNQNIRAVFSYEGFESVLPESSTTGYVQRCTDEADLVPYWNSYVPQGDIPDSLSELNVHLNQSTGADGTLTLYWQVNDTPLRTDWANPTTMSVREGKTDFPDRANVIKLPTSNVWTYWVMTQGGGVPFDVQIPHPIHLHGHDFYILGAGTSAWTDADREGLNYDNPIRRDVAMLPSNGWLAIAFLTNNPGAWLAHCHIAWHADEGFAVQFLEAADTMLDIDPLPTDFDEQCDDWDFYYKSAMYLQSDSGI